MSYKLEGQAFEHCFAGSRSLAQFGGVPHYIFDMNPAGAESVEPYVLVHGKPGIEINRMPLLVMHGTGERSLVISPADAGGRPWTWAHADIRIKGNDGRVASLTEHFRLESVRVIAHGRNAGLEVARLAVTRPSLVNGVVFVGTEPELEAVKQFIENSFGWYQSKQYVTEIPGRTIFNNSGLVGDVLDALRCARRPNNCLMTTRG